MSNATTVRSAVQGTSTDFGADDLILVAISYRANKAIVDAASKFDNIEDAVASLKETWEKLQSQSENGASYTPDTDLGFGSSNAREIAEGIMGTRATVSSTRKALKDLGNTK